MYHVYDTIIYPPQHSSKVPARIGGWLWRNLISSSNDIPEEKEAKQDELTILETRVLRRTCLEVYLHKELEMIHNGNFDDRASGLEHIIDNMIYVYNQLYSPMVHNGRAIGHYTEWTCRNLEHVRNVHAESSTYARIFMTLLSIWHPLQMNSQLFGITPAQSSCDEMDTNQN